MRADITVLGGYVAEECPEPWEHQFVSAEGQPLDLAGYTAQISWRAAGGDTETRTAVVGDDAKVTYVWVDGDLDTPGTYRGELTVTNGTNTFVRRWCMRVRPQLAPVT